MLLNVLNIYASNEGNDAMRFSIMEATALALSRALGVGAKYKEALAAVEKALAVKPYFNSPEGRQTYLATESRRQTSSASPGKICRR